MCVGGKEMDRVLVPVSIDHVVFCFWPHFLSVNCRKSRSSWFSICSLAISFSYSSVLLNGRFLGRPFGLGGIPVVVLAVFRL